MTLEVALQAQHRVALQQQFRVHTPVRIVAGGAALANRLVLKHKRPALRRMAFPAGVHLGGQGFHPAFDGITFVGIVAIATGNLAFSHRVVMRQAKLSLFIQMALVAGFGRFARIDNRAGRAS